MKANIQKVITDINKQYGENTVVIASKALGLIYHRYSTGSFGIDMGTGGGFCSGRIHLIIGKESCGKTALCCLNIAEIQKGDLEAVCAYVDGEQTFDAKKAQDLGVDLDRLLLVNPDSLEQAGDVVQELLESKILRNLTIDSWASLFPTAEYQDDMDNNQMGKNALGKNKMMRKIIGAMKKDLMSPDPSCILVITNHITMKIGMTFGNPETDSGGMAKNYFTSIKIKLTRTGYLKKTINGILRVVGIPVKWNVEKNKTSVPKKEGDYDYYFATTKDHGMGIDAGKELFDYAKKHKIITKNYDRRVFDRKYLANSVQTKLLKTRIKGEELGIEANKIGAKKSSLKKGTKPQKREKALKKA